jgi:phosphatidylserine decarboxylase
MTSVPSTQHPPVAREGWAALSITAGVGIALYAAFGLGGAATALVVFVLLCIYFRDPYRDSPSLPLALFAPIDGVVTYAETTADPWLGREAVQISVRMGLADIHTLFSPTEGKIVEQWSEPRHVSTAGRAPQHAVAYLIRTDEGDDIVIEIARGPVGGALRFYYQPGERVGHGRRIGYATLGCRVTLYVAPESSLDCQPGTRVSAAVSVLSTMVHAGPVTALHD